MLTKEQVNKQLDKLIDELYTIKSRPSSKKIRKFLNDYEEFIDNIEENFLLEALSIYRLMYEDRYKEYIDVHDTVFKDIYVSNPGVVYIKFVEYGRNILDEIRRKINRYKRAGYGSEINSSLVKNDLSLLLEMLELLESE